MAHGLRTTAWNATARSSSCLLQGCWPFTVELTQVERCSSTSTTLPRRWLSSCIGDIPIREGCCSAGCATALNAFLSVEGGKCLPQVGAALCRDNEIANMLRPMQRRHPSTRMSTRMSTRASTQTPLSTSTLSESTLSESALPDSTKSTLSEPITMTMSTRMRSRMSTHMRTQMSTHIRHVDLYALKSAAPH
ncbi:hypothetical protein HaLaN_09709 [Haematococcus lacustris]|uniref:Uncharacterized protein n=1 Tax=Haematococcus lacustris TaxID=44745 RepID=A0A699Z4C4_HAELA|nr:hypothetical protein HaLaN_09709 [Haematococcus lacustris]